VQYRPSVSAFAVYMTQYQLLPYQRTAKVLNELAGLGISPGTLQRAVRVAATRLEAPINTDRLTPASLIPNVGPRPWMGSAC